MKTFFLIVLATLSCVLSTIPVSAQPYQSISLFSDLQSLASSLLPAPVRTSISIGFAIACIVCVFSNCRDLSFKELVKEVSTLFLDFRFEKQLIPLAGIIANVINLGIFLGLNIYLAWNAITPFRLGTQTGRVAFVCYNESKITCWIDYGRTFELFIATLILYVFLRCIIEFFVTQSSVLALIQQFEEKERLK